MILNNYPHGPLYHRSNCGASNSAPISSASLGPHLVRPREEPGNEAQLAPLLLLLRIGCGNRPSAESLHTPHCQTYN